MATVLQVPVVAYGYLVERLRRLPLLGSVLRHTSLVAAGLIVGAVAAFLVWAGTVAPQRVGLGDLVTASVSHMQTWIIISGDLGAGPPRFAGHRYILTDPAVPNAIMYVLSEVELPLGYSTISGSYVGGREPVPVGYRWIGTMRADAELAYEPGPPLVTIILLTVAGLTVVAGRISYPMFFGQAPRRVVPQLMTLQVGIRRGPLTTAGPPLPGELLLEPGAPVRLRVPGADPQQLRLHSVRTGVEAGELRHLTTSEPALRVQPATGEVTLSFASRDERDAAFAALIADAEQWSQAIVPRTTGSAHGELR